MDGVSKRVDTAMAEFETNQILKETTILEKQVQLSIARISTCLVQEEHMVQKSDGLEQAPRVYFEETLKHCVPIAKGTNH